MSTRRIGRWQLVTRAAIGAALTLVGVLAPIESSRLPDPVGDIVGSPQAAAQVGSVITVTPNPCPTVPELWDDATATDPPDVCVLMRPACPVSPLSSTTPGVDVEFRPSISYTSPPGLNTFPDFCEARILQSQDPATYAACMAATGYAVLRYQDGPDPGCRLVTPTSCIALMHRIRSDLCRAVQRRTWDCPTGSIPRNEFSTCFVLPILGTTAHPACGTGTPSFAISSCEEYVGQDYIDPTDPAARTCASYGLVNNPRIGASSDYWCEYNAALLEVRCHAARANCPRSAALCIKRASQTGGCDSIAATINCRSLQERFARSAVTIEEVLRNQCYPCNILPFSPPTGCPEEIDGDPDAYIYSTDVDDILFRVKTDYAASNSACAFLTATAGHPSDSPSCDSVPVCVDPPRGVLSWESSHHSDHAIVNSPVIVDILDIPTRYESEYKFTYNNRNTNRPITAPGFTSSHVMYNQGSRETSEVRTWQPVYTHIQFRSVRSMVGRGECTITGFPSFRAVVRELWPDNSEDRAEIVRFFGNDSLDWWNALSTAEQQRRTSARGLQWAMLFTPSQLETRRQDHLIEAIECNNVSVLNRTDRMWCRWMPKRSGYYLITAEGAWRTNLRRSRHWSWVQEYWINRYLQDPDNRANLVSALDAANRSRASYRLPALTFADLGLDAPSGEPIGTLARPTDLDEWLYTARSTNLTGCTPIDLRISCDPGRGTGANYTVTEPIGIRVHEIRVSTVMPDN